MLVPPLAHHKSEGPASSLTFLGIGIDTVHFQLSLPAEKPERLQTLLRQWLPRRACTRKELDSLIGHLSHAATVIRPGRIFLRPLFSLMSRGSNPSHFVRLNVEVRADIAWWQCLLQHWNGRSFSPIGFNLLCVLRRIWLFWLWGIQPETEYLVSIGMARNLECNRNRCKGNVTHIVIAAAIWGPGWSGEHIHLCSDNEAVVTTIQRRHARHPLLSNLLRCLFFYASYYHFHFSSSHIPGVRNTTADAISRNYRHMLYFLLPHASRTAIPDVVLQFLLSLPLWGSPSWIELFTHSLTQVSPPQPAATTQVSTAT